jgi:hypothetical protein
MKSTESWKPWESRLQLLWPDHLKNHIKFVQEDGELPVLDIEGVPFSLAPSFWGLGHSSEDRQTVEEAFEAIIQGHAPEYWKSSQNPIVQALGWFDRRIGKRSWRQFEERYENGAAINPLEQQLRQARLHAEQKLDSDL